MGGSDMSGTDSSKIKMAFLLEHLSEQIIKTVFDFFPNFPREVDGVRKYQGFMLVGEAGEVDGEESLSKAQFGRLADAEKTFQVLMRKRAGKIAAGVSTSFEARNAGNDVPDDEKTWGGWSDDEGISGLPELADHVWLVTLQRFAGKLSREEYEMRVSISWPGIQDSIDQFGVTESQFLYFVDQVREMTEAVTRIDNWEELFGLVAQ
jgi:hypothetical protein